jgi:AGZA family xanthine/uracil permease-like MFS transporter
MARFAGLQDPETMDFENSTIAYCVDAFAISMGALMGTSPVTTFVESATGIRGIDFTSFASILRSNHFAEGGKTGITGMVTGLAFFVSVFFAPIFSSIPGWATGGALVFVGSSMMRKCVLIILYEIHAQSSVPAYAKLTGTMLAMLSLRS